MLTFGFFTFWLIIRSVFAYLFLAPSDEFLTAPFFYRTSYVVFISINICITVGVIILNAQGLEYELKMSIEEIRALRGILPICAGCKKIRDDQGYWNQIESYFQEHSDIEFSHSLCPDCMKDIYPDFYEKYKKDSEKGWNCLTIRLFCCRFGSIVSKKEVFLEISIPKRRQNDNKKGFSFS